MVSEKPWKFGLPVLRPSEASTVLSPILMLRMHHLLGAAGRNHRLIGRLLEAHDHFDCGAKRLLIELDRFFGAAFKEQIGLYLHGVSFVGLGTGGLTPKMARRTALAY